jgi:group I intron endonuclease
MGIIYKLTSPSGKVYIGQTVKSFETRLSKHESAAKNLNKMDGCRLLNNAIRKYGFDSFEKIVFFECDDSDLNEFEQFCIAMLETMAPKGYNLTEGGDSGKKSDATKAKMSESAFKRNTTVYRKTEETKLLPKYVQVVGNGFRISKHPRCRVKTFTRKTADENLLDALSFIDYLDNNPDIVIEPPVSTLEPGLQRLGKDGYRVCYKLKNGKVATKRFTKSDTSAEEKYLAALEHLNWLKQHDKD